MRQALRSQVTPSLPYNQVYRIICLGPKGSGKTALISQIADMNAQYNPTPTEHCRQVDCRINNSLYQIWDTPEQAVSEVRAYHNSIHCYWLVIDANSKNIATTINQVLSSICGYGVQTTPIFIILSKLDSVSAKQKESSKAAVENYKRGTQKLIFQNFHGPFACGATDKTGLNALMDALRAHVKPSPTMDMLEQQTQINGFAEREAARANSSWCCCFGGKSSKKKEERTPLLPTDPHFAPVVYGSQRN